MIPTILVSLVAYAAGTYGAPAAASEVLRASVRRSPGHLALTMLVASAEALLGFGTTALAFALSTWTARPDTGVLVAAAAVGIGFGIVRSIRSVPREGAGVTEEASQYVGRMVRFGAVLRAGGAVLLPLAMGLMGA